MQEAVRSAEHCDTANDWMASWLDGSTTLVTLFTTPVSQIDSESEPVFAINLQ